MEGFRWWDGRGWERCEGRRGGVEVEEEDLGRVVAGGKTSLGEGVEGGGPWHANLIDSFLSCSDFVILV